MQQPPPVYVVKGMKGKPGEYGGFGQHQQWAGAPTHLHKGGAAPAASGALLPGQFYPPPGGMGGGPFLAPPGQQQHLVYNLPAVQQGTPASMQGVPPGAVVAMQHSPTMMMVSPPHQMQPNGLHSAASGVVETPFNGVVGGAAPSSAGASAGGSQQFRGGAASGEECATQPGGKNSSAASENQPVEATDLPLGTDVNGKMVDLPTDVSADTGAQQKGYEKYPFLLNILLNDASVAKLSEDNLKLKLSSKHGVKILIHHGKIQMPPVKDLTRVQLQGNCPHKIVNTQLDLVKLFDKCFAIWQIKDTDLAKKIQISVGKIVVKFKPGCPDLIPDFGGMLMLSGKQYAEDVVRRITTGSNSGADRFALEESSTLERHEEDPTVGFCLTAGWGLWEKKAKTLPDRIDISHTKPNAKKNVGGAPMTAKGMTTTKGSTSEGADNPVGGDVYSALNPPYDPNASPEDGRSGLRHFASKIVNPGNYTAEQLLQHGVRSEVDADDPNPVPLPGSRLLTKKMVGSSSTTKTPATSEGPALPSGGLTKGDLLEDAAVPKSPSIFGPVAKATAAAPVPGISGTFSALPKSTAPPPGTSGGVACQTTNAMSPAKPRSVGAI